MATTWGNNAVQFPRLLAEIRAVGLTPEQYAGLAESMDLEDRDDIDELLERAESAWQTIKAETPHPAATADSDDDDGGPMTLQRAFEIVLELARGNIIEAERGDPDMADEEVDQTEACDIIDKFAEAAVIAQRLIGDASKVP